MTGKIDIQGGKIVFGSARFKQAIRELKDGSYMWSLEEWKQSKTNQQIRFIHGPVVKAYSDYTGYTKEEAKYMLKVKFGFNKLIKDRDSGRQILQVRSLADYTKEQMQELLNRVLHHLEYDCGMVIDAETRKQFHIDHETGELTEISNMG